MTHTDQDTIDNLQYLVTKLAGENERLTTEVSWYEEAYDFLVDELIGLRRATNNAKKLSDRQVYTIRRFYEIGKYNQAELAGLFEVNPATISRIIRDVYHAQR